MDNLDKQRPVGWRDASLFCFVEDSWNNALATFNAMPEQVGRLELIDSLFAQFSQHRLTNPSNYFAGLLFIRAHTAYRVGAGVALATPIESYSVSRSSLEYAGYALLCHKRPELAEVWIRRDEGTESLARVRREFTQARVREAIKSFDAKISERYQYLYDAAISWGAHPNEKALTTSLRIDQDPIKKVTTLQVIMLPHGGNIHKLALRRCGQIGLCVLEIFALIYPERFQLLGIKDKFRDARRGQ
jgi:hypothetical protein